VFIKSSRWPLPGSQAFSRRFPEIRPSWAHHLDCVVKFVMRLAPQWVSRPSFSVKLCRHRPSFMAGPRFLCVIRCGFHLNLVHHFHDCWTYSNWVPLAGALRNRVLQDSHKWQAIVAAVRAGGVSLCAEKAGPRRRSAKSRQIRGGVHILQSIRGECAEPSAKIGFQRRIRQQNAAAMRQTPSTRIPVGYETARPEFRGSRAAGDGKRLDAGVFNHPMQ